MTVTSLAIEATGLRKSFGGKAVLDGIDLDVASGTVFSLLGPNGAGKTTVVQIMSTLVRADAGEVRVAGHDVARDPAAVRAAIGVTGQFSAVDNLLTGEENLLLMADLHAPGPGGSPRGAPPSCWGSSSWPTPRKAARDLLRRHAPAARPGDDPGRRPAHHLPRRADHRP